MSCNARQVKIDLITDTPNEIIAWFNSIWCRLNVVETNVYHTNGGEFIYYLNLKPRIAIFYHDNTKDIFLAEFDNYWSVLKYEFKCSYHEIQDITKLLVENVANEIPTPMVGYYGVEQEILFALDNI